MALSIRTTHFSLFILRKTCSLQVIRKNQYICSQTARSLSTTCLRQESFPPRFYNRKSNVDKTLAATGFIESKEDFRFVDRLIPSLEPPPPPVHEKYPTPSGWSPAKGAATGTPYTIRRTRYHTIPVYIELNFGDTQQMTVIKNVEGDIWAFAEELKTHLEGLEGYLIPLRVNEVTRKVRFKGMFREVTKTWLADKGF